MVATYPELINATSLYSGVAAGCFVSSNGGVDQLNKACARGAFIKTAQEWGEIARAMFPNYNGT